MIVNLSTACSVDGGHCGDCALTQRATSER